MIQQATPGAVNVWRDGLTAVAQARLSATGSSNDALAVYKARLAEGLTRRKQATMENAERQAIAQIVQVRHAMYTFASTTVQLNRTLCTLLHTEQAILLGWRPFRDLHSLQRPLKPAQTTATGVRRSARQRTLAAASAGCAAPAAAAAASRSGSDTACSAASSPSRTTPILPAASTTCSTLLQHVCSLLHRRSGDEVEREQLALRMMRSSTLRDVLAGKNDISGEPVEMCVCVMLCCGVLW